MRSNCLSALLAITFLVLVPQARAETRSLQWKTKVAVDGKNLEWSSPLPCYDKKTGFNYDLANDGRNLYVILRVVDQNVQRQLLSSGFEVWLDPNGGRKKTCGVAYPMPVTTVAASGMPGGQPGPPPGMMPMQGDSAFVPGPPPGFGTDSTDSKMTSADGQGLDPTQAGQTTQARPGNDNGQPPVGGMPPRMDGNSRGLKDAQFDKKNLTLTGFKGTNGLQPVKNSPVHVAMALDPSDCLVYELAVPLAAIGVTDINEHVLSVCLLVKKGETPKRTSNAGMSMQGMGGGMGGPGGGMGGPGGGMGGGPGGGMGGEGGQMGDQAQGVKVPDQQAVNLSEKKTWIKVTLAGGGH